MPSELSQSISAHDIEETFKNDDLSEMHVDMSAEKTPPAESTNLKTTEVLKVSKNIMPAGKAGPNDAKLIVESCSESTKYNFCIYCKAQVIKMPRHLETVHKNEKEIREILLLPKGCKDRNDALNLLRNKGNYNYAMENKKLVVMRRTKDSQTGDNYLPCARCFGFFKRNTLKRHFKRCTGIDNTHDRVATKLGKMTFNSFDKEASIPMRERILPFFRDDLISRTIRFDELIILYGNFLCLKYRSNHLNYMIRSRLRLLARLLIEIKKLHTPIENFKMIFHHSYFDTYINAVHKVAGMNEITGEYRSPAVASNLGTYTKEIGEVYNNHCIRKDDEDAIKNIQKFFSLHSKEFRTTVSTAAIETRKKLSRQKIVKLPKSEDIKKLNDFLDLKGKEAYLKLSNRFSIDEWKSLSETTLVKMLLFKRKTN